MPTTLTHGLSTGPSLPTPEATFRAQKQGAHEPHYPTSTLPGTAPSLGHHIPSPGAPKSPKPFPALGTSGTPDPTPPGHTGPLTPSSGRNLASPEILPPPPPRSQQYESATDGK